MALFTRKINSVRETRIFGRGQADGRQVLVYQAVIDAPETVGLVLPLPVASNTQRDDVRFFDMTKYAALFVDLGMGFPSPPLPPKPLGSKGGAVQEPYQEAPTGEYTRAFAPTVAAFPDLNEILRLPAELVQKTSEYARYGFAAFGLPAGRHRIGPIALDFPRRDPKQIFFPTQHAEVGVVPERADIPCTLFAQTIRQPMTEAQTWRESKRPAGFYVRAAKLPQPQFVDLENHFYQCDLLGPRPNRDLFLDAG